MLHIAASLVNSGIAQGGTQRFSRRNNPFCPPGRVLHYLAHVNSISVKDLYELNTIRGFIASYLPSVR